nr:MAG TPA: HOLLIDAY JUNCTION RESOLVASE [Caudoviricetes sp.]
MKILSLDLSSTSSGYAVLEDGKIIDYGTIKSNDPDYVIRGHYMAESVKVLLSKHSGFDIVVIEELKVLKNQKVLVMLGVIQGMVIRECFNSQVEFIPPTMWRKPYGLNGKREEAKKKAIQYCKDKGVDVNTDDEAEAILLGKYFSKRVDSNLSM